MTWDDGTRVRWHGYGSPGLVALAERMNEQERVEAEARRQSNRGGAMDTLFDEAPAPALGAGFELPDGWGWVTPQGGPFPIVAMLADRRGVVIVHGETEADVALRAGQLARGLRGDELSDPDERQLGPFVRDSETSRQAALANYPRQGSQRWRILDALTTRDVETPPGRARGLTREELSDRTGLAGDTVRPRVVELIAGGWVVESEQTRQTRAGNAAALVLLTDKAATYLPSGAS